jgi:hypothetical protein
MPMIFDVLRSRAQSAEATALDTIAAAARAVAAGGTADVNAVEAALAVVGKKPDDFEAAVALAGSGGAADLRVIRVSDGDTFTGLDAAPVAPWEWRKTEKHRKTVWKAAGAGR